VAALWRVLFAVRRAASADPPAGDWNFNENVNTVNPFDRISPDSENKFTELWLQ
jgi:hypothetical protein